MGQRIHCLRDRLLDYGPGDRETAELIGIVLSGADARPDLIASVAQRIDAGSLAVSSLGSAATAEFGRSCGAALAAAIELVRRMSLAPAPPAIHGPADVALIAQREIGWRFRERAVVIICDAANQVLRTVVITDGAINRSLLPVREILNAVLRCDGDAFAIAHNHPSGDIEPSDADRIATNRIADAARVVGLRFLGHVVVTHTDWTAAPIQPRQTRDSAGREQAHSIE